MKRRNLLIGGGALVGGVAVSEALPRLAWRHSLATDTDDYAQVLVLVPDWEDFSGVSVEEREVEPAQVADLAYHRAKRYVIRGANRDTMELLYLEYKEGNPRYFEDLFYHVPERCMAAAGEVTEQIFRVATVKNTDIEVRCVTFREYKSDLELYVYKAIWLHSTYPVTMGKGLHRKKIQAGLSLKPCPPARMMMAAIRGVQSEPEAWRQFEELALSRLAQREADTSGVSL